MYKSPTYRCSEASSTRGSRCRQSTARDKPVLALPLLPWKCSLASTNLSVVAKRPGSSNPARQQLRALLVGGDTNVWSAHPLQTPAKDTVEKYKKQIGFDTGRTYN
ncbi:hypothetical protein NDU88_005919 [Pleurodeles waltl]|uniref:Uncharacterized protein n=1 Tax=Pleurodeles waltl TaxID=8319 RepID=A0AAV7UJI6_PLEWA|nr:hypothetical protein NDU88_005919 [Pleurodeles waltl]